MISGAASVSAMNPRTTLDTSGPVVSAKTPVGKALCAATVSAVVPPRLAAEPMNVRRVSPVAPVGVLAFMRKLLAKKKPLADPHESEGQSAALLDAQALHWTQKRP